MSKIINRKKLTALFLSAVMLISALFAYNTVAYADDDEIEDLKDQIAEYEDKINSAQDKIDSLAGDITKVKEYIQELDAQVALYQEQIDAYQTQIDEYNGQIDSYEAENQKHEEEKEALQDKIDGYNDEIDDLNIKIDAKYDELKELIRDNYISGETSAAEVLLCSDDFSDYLTKIQFISSLADYEQGLVDSINEDINAINGKIAQIDEEKAKIEAIQAEIDKKIDEIQVLSTSVEENQAKVVANQDKIEEKVAENSNYLASLNNQSAEYNAMIENYEAEIEAFNEEIEELIRAQASSGSGMLENSSGLICPIQNSGRYISSGFYRNSDGSYHGALDICVYGGTYGEPIVAAESGTVITASYHWSYGNYVLIDHGNGLSTLYAHCSSLAVGAGQSVSKGQTIAYAGSTGNSTGPHLHFEVRVNGTRVDPSSYITV